MTAEEREFIEFRLGQARQTLKDAEMLFEAGSLASAMNRLYYACFYAVSALLIKEGGVPTRHKGLLSAFDRNWINAGRLPRKMGRLLHELFDARLQGDYGYPAGFERQDVALSLQEARAFIAEISLVVVKQTRKEEEEEEEEEEEPS